MTKKTSKNMGDTLVKWVTQGIKSAIELAAAPVDALLLPATYRLIEKDKDPIFNIYTIVWTLYFIGDNTLINKDAMESILSVYIKEGLIDEKDIEELYSKGNKIYPENVYRTIKFALVKNICTAIKYIKMEADNKCKIMLDKEVEKFNLPKLEQLENFFSLNKQESKGFFGNLKAKILDSMGLDPNGIYTTKDQVGLKYANKRIFASMYNLSLDLDLKNVKLSYDSYSFEFLNRKAFEEELKKFLKLKTLSKKNNDILICKNLKYRDIISITEYMIRLMFAVNPLTEITSINFIKKKNNEKVLYQMPFLEHTNMEDNIADKPGGKDKKYEQREKIINVLKPVAKYGTILDLILKKEYDVYHRHINNLYINVKNFTVSVIAIKSILKKLNITDPEIEKFYKLTEIISIKEDKFKELLEFLKYDLFLVKMLIAGIDKDNLTKSFKDIIRKTNSKELKELIKVAIKSYKELEQQIENWNDYIFNPFRNDNFKEAFWGLKKAIDNILNQTAIVNHGFGDTTTQLYRLKTDIRIFFGEKAVSKGASNKKSVKAEGGMPFSITLKYEDLFKLTEQLFNNNIEPYTVEHISNKVEKIINLIDKYYHLPVDSVKKLAKSYSGLWIVNMNNNFPLWDPKKVIEEYYNNIINKRLKLQNEKKIPLDLTKIPIDPYNIEWRFLYEIRKLVYSLVSFGTIGGIYTPKRVMGYDSRKLDYIRTLELLDEGVFKPFIYNHRLEHKKYNEWIKKNIINFNINKYKPYEDNTLDIDENKPLNKLLFHTPLELWHDNNIDLNNINRRKIKYLDNVKFWHRWEGGQGINAVLTFLNRYNQVYQYIGYKYSKNGEKIHKFGFVESINPAPGIFLSKGEIKETEKNKGKVQHLIYNPLCIILPKVNGILGFNFFSNMGGVHWTTRIPDIEDPKIWKRHSKDGIFFPNKDGKYKEYKEYMLDFLADYYNDASIREARLDNSFGQRKVLKYFNDYILNHKTLPGTNIKIFGEKTDFFEHMRTKHPYAEKVAGDLNLEGRYGSRGAFRLYNGFVEDTDFDKPLEEQFGLGYIYLNIGEKEEFGFSSVKLCDTDLYIYPEAKMDYRKTLVYDVYDENKRIYKINKELIILEFLLGKNLYNLALWKYFPDIMAKAHFCLMGLNPITQESSDKVKQEVEKLKSIILNPTPYTTNKEILKYLDNDTDIFNLDKISLYNPFEYSNNIEPYKEESWINFNKFIYNFMTFYYKGIDEIGHLYSYKARNRVYYKGVHGYR